MVQRMVRCYMAEALAAFDGGADGEIGTDIYYGGESLLASLRRTPRNRNLFPNKKAMRMAKS